VITLFTSFIPDLQSPGWNYYLRGGTSGGYGNAECYLGNELPRNISRALASGYLRNSGNAFHAGNCWPRLSIPPSISNWVAPLTTATQLRMHRRRMDCNTRSTPAIEKRPEATRLRQAHSVTKGCQQELAIQKDSRSGSCQNQQFPGVRGLRCARLPQAGSVLQCVHLVKTF